MKAIQDITFTVMMLAVCGLMVALVVEVAKLI